MATASLASQTTSNRPIAAHCTVSVIAILATFNLINARMSSCMLHPKSLTLLMTSQFPFSYESHALAFSSFPQPIDSPTHVKNLSTPETGQENLYLNALLHSLNNTWNKKMLSCPHPRSTLLRVKSKAK